MLKIDMNLGGGITMESAHLHLTLNHFPLITLFVAIPLLLFAAWRGQEQFRRVATVVTLISGLLTIPAYLTGEEAEEQVEHLPGFDHDLIEQHEESGKIALIASLVTAAAAAGVGFIGWRRKATPSGLLVILAVIGAGALGLIGVAANQGGLIRHQTEIRGTSE